MGTQGIPVRIGGLVLGEKLICSDPNPQKITYTKDFNIVVHDTLPKPKTQCTQPQSLVKMRLEFTTTSEESSNTLMNMDAGPHYVETDRFVGPCYIENLSGIQEPGDKNVMRWTMELIEAYDG